MDAELETTDAPGTPPAVRLAVAWADFTKALSIYPPTNTRVQAQRDAFLEAILEALGARGSRRDAERGVSILLQDTAIHVDDVRTEMPAVSAVPWLRERLAHAGLAGVEFMPGVQGEALVGFTQQLLTNYLRKEPGLGFEDLWPGTWPGIVLVDLRFEGTFGGEASTGPWHGGHGGIPKAQTSHFIRGLLAHPKVSRRIQRFGAMAQAEDGDTTSASRLLGGILEEVPAEALASRDALITAVCRILDGLEEVGAAPRAPRSDGGPEVGGEAFAALLRDVSRRHFGRRGPGLERLRPEAPRAAGRPPGGGRARDKAIDDDPRALVAELEELPEKLSYDFGRGEAESSAEQLATLLHYLTHLRSPEALPGLHPLLSRLVRTPGRAELDLLRSHLAAGAGEGAAGAGHQALVDFLVASRNAHLLRVCGLISPAFVLADPAANLPLYLAASDPHAGATGEELEGICRELGAGLLSFEAAMRDELAALPVAQVVDVLRSPSAARIPLARALLASHGGAIVQEGAAFLRAVDPPDDEAFVLYQMHDQRWITRTYLVAMLDQQLGRIDPRVTRSAVVDLLCRHIRGMHTVDRLHADRLASIRSLARYPTTRGAAMLEELQRTRFGPFGGAEPAAVRKLARSVMKQMRGARPDLPLAGLTGGLDGIGTRAA